MELWLVVLLSVLNVAQFFFWSMQVHRLVNKLMSKNFAEYNAIISGPEPVAPRPPDLEAEHEEQEILKELNSMVSIS